MKVAITGSSGMIGTALAASLRADSHQVVRLVRRPPRSAGEVRWDPQAADGAIDPDKLAGIDACVNLWGSNIRMWLRPVVFRHAARLSGGDVVLVDEAAKDLFSVDSMLGEVDLRWPSMSLSRRQLVQGAMWPGCVVVGQVFGQYLAQLVLVDNQHAVE